MARIGRRNDERRSDLLARGEPHAADPPARDLDAVNVGAGPDLAPLLLDQPAEGLGRLAREAKPVDPTLRRLDAPANEPATTPASRARRC